MGYPRESRFCGNVQSNATKHVWEAFANKVTAPNGQRLVQFTITGLDDPIMMLPAEVERLVTALLRANGYEDFLPLEEGYRRVLFEILSSKALHDEHPGAKEMLDSLVRSLREGS